MAALAADRDLLFGLLALQNGLIDQVQLVSAFKAWTRDKAHALADRLVGRGDLEADDRSAVEALLVRQLKKHGEDVERSLAAISAGRDRGEALAKQAIDAIRQATAAGYADIETMVPHTDLDALRPRGDFQSLMTSVRAQAAAGPCPAR